MAMIQYDIGTTTTKIVVGYNFRLVVAILYNMRDLNDSGRDSPHADVHYQLGRLWRYSY